MPVELAEVVVPGLVVPGVVVPGVVVPGVVVPEVVVPEVGDAEEDVEPAAVDGLDCVSLVPPSLQPLNVKPTIRIIKPIDAQGRHTDLLISCHIQQ
jgi:hypothetical protein